VERQEDVQQFCAEIRNAAFLVRHYRRPRDRERRAEAIRSLGEVCRMAFNSTEDYEALLVAIVDALKPQDYEPPF
jgi:hypothetical protein